MPQEMKRMDNVDTSRLLLAQEKINSLYDEIGLKEIHMVRLDEKQKERVIRILDFTKSDILAWCLKVDKQHIVDYMYNHLD